ncbi:sporulation protein YqfC [Natranaerovirga pectinivora]|uniref:Sporulation protein YqfC n=1 Tax=Natranaerovirga pectinivora TaxID=682400 RepID=A0A4R3MQI7_9FIRM|nr:YabP/YqfC family sporulation protein [Natranaerovirga pectinivora]TCT17054.1 sporulation protein YqfC [Natranaerovirga pectinivora]
MKKKLRSEEHSIKKNLTQALNLPQDVTLGASLVTITGKNEVFIENYKGIIEYDTDYIKLSTKQGIIELRGKRFLINYLTDDEMKITGRISNINFM